MKASKGFTLIELLLTLGVLAILLVAMFVVYPQVSTRIQVNREMAGYRAIAASIRTLCPRPPYTGLNGTLLRQAGLIPRSFDLPEGTNAIRNSWGSTINISAWGNNDAVAGGTTRVRLVTTAVPKEACILMAQGVFEFADQAYEAPTGQAPWQPNYLVSRNDPALMAQLCAAENSNGFTFGVFFQP